MQVTICPGVIGGRLDFPRSASFASMKLVLWWEEEYVAAYRKPSGFLQKQDDLTNEENNSGFGCGGIVKASDPVKFVSLISKSADQLLGIFLTLSDCKLSILFKIIFIFLHKKLLIMLT